MQGIAVLARVNVGDGELPVHRLMRNVLDAGYGGFLVAPRCDARAADGARAQTGCRARGTAPFRGALYVRARSIDRAA
ncbi:MAG: hypothetical protein QM661_03325 [Solimonas sp.]